MSAPAPRSGGQLGLAVSLNSFVLGFLIGSAVFYALNCTGSVDVCIGCEVDGVPPPPSLTSLLAGDRERVTPTHKRIPSPERTSRKPSKAVTQEARDAEDPGPSCPEAPLRLVILILSSPGGSLRRNAIRGTWIHDIPRERLQVTLRFLVGAKNLSSEHVSALTSEADMFHDILFFSDHKDTYSNLTAKVLMALTWADRNLDFDYLIKADDDSYVRVNKIDAALRELKCPPRLYWGYFIGHAVPETAGRWAEKHWTQCPHYLPYAMGGGYVLSRAIVGLLGRFHTRFKQYSNEDVSLGSWLAPFDVTYHHDLRFNTEAASHGCNNHYIISHKEKVRSMYEKYVHLKKNGTLCVEEKEIRPAYVYNWTAASPMDCCNRTKGIPIPI